MLIQMPDKVKDIINIITQAGFEGYAVGGCIRDSILNRVPDDWDITTSAKPEDIKKLFPRTVDTGIEHGTVTVMIDKEGFEVTTYRIDGEYVDSRHPSQVIFTPNLIEDLKRRDFTINAMAYNDQMGLIDAFCGLEDIKNKKIRCVGNPKERFGEDALRIMRAVRFSAQLGYDIEESTLSALEELAPTLEKISVERIQVELVKLLVSPYPEYLRKAYELGITKIILPEFDDCMNTLQHHPHHRYSVGEHTLQALMEVPQDKKLRLASLLHDIGKPTTQTIDEEGFHHFYGHGEVGAKIANKILRRLRFDNETIQKVSRMVRFHDYGMSTVPNEKIVRKAIYKIGEDIFPQILIVRKADILAQSDYLREEKLHQLELWKDLYREIKEKEQCTSLKMLAICGTDLIEHGILPGKEIGNKLEFLLEHVLDYPEDNQKDILLQIIFSDQRRHL